MEKIIQYLETAAEIDNAELLRLYNDSQMKNKLLANSMNNNQKARDKYLRYDIWKKLPADIKGKFNQDLTQKPQKHKTVIKVGTKLEIKFDDGKLFTDGISKVTDEAGDVYIVNLENGVVTEVNPYTPSEEGDDDSEDKENAKTEGEEEAKPESEEEAKLESEEETKLESEDEKIQLKAKLTRERAVLSNELAKYEEDDNDGRLIILKQMNEIDEQIKALFEPTETQQQKEIKIDWLKSDTETVKMTEAEIKVYKKSLSDRRGKASAAIKAGKNVAHNQQLLQIIDEAKLKLG